MRRESTPAERKLWQALRDRGVAGAKARRQVPCGPYVLDFLYSEQRLVIEVDGDTHSLPERAAAEARRAAWLAGYGIRVLRFANRDVLGNLAGVLQVIAAVLHRPHPGPLPEGEGAGLPLPLGEGRGEGGAAAP